MKTARMSAAASQLVGGGDTRRSALKTAALESAVDAYATRILEERSPPEARVDSSLGPYVTSVLRSWDTAPFTDISELDEFDSLVELVEEHCSMERDDAVRTLKSIADAVRTGFVSEHGMEYGRSVLDYSFSAGGLIPIFSTQQQPDTDGGAEEVLPLGELPSPLKPDSLIPFDLLGVLDDPPTQSSGVDVKETSAKEEFPPLGGASTSSPGRKVKGKKTAAKESAAGLVAVLFRPAHSSHPLETEDARSPKHIPVTPAVVPPPMQTNEYFQQQWDAAVEMLLSMNHELSDEAAAEAAYKANTDVNVAQYVIDGALAAPAVCRHMLNDGCYRSDCQFSHDIDGHTCLFWLRGRCGKGDHCRFLHGFSDKLLEGIHHDFEQSAAAYMDHTTRLPKSSGLKSEPLPIATSKFTSSSSLPSFGQSNSMSMHNTFPGPASAGLLQPITYSLPSSWESPLHSQMNPAAVRAFEKKETSFSFANIATRGYDRSSFSSAPSVGGYAQAAAAVAAHTVTTTISTAAVSVTATTTTTSAAPSAGLTKTVKIPQDLWNPHINRDASAFHIADPLERYHQVAQSVQRTDVVDLHFQSTKTFSAVLERILPEKLDKHTQVWVVTGSGHHVGTKTHQRGGGALESAVMTWLHQEGYEYVRGRDRNGHGGALLVRR